MGRPVHPWSSPRPDGCTRAHPESKLPPRRASRLAGHPHARCSELEIHIDGELQALTEEGASELARFEAEVGQIAVPSASVLLCTESGSNSDIENLASSARQIALEELGEHASKDAQLIVGNVGTLGRSPPPWWICLSQNRFKPRENGGPTSPVERAPTVGRGVPAPRKRRISLGCDGPRPKRQSAGNHSVKKDLRRPRTSNRVE